MQQDLPGFRAADDRISARSKPTIAQLGVDLAAQLWQRSGTGQGSFEVAFVRSPGSAPVGHDAGHGAGAGADWVLLRVVGDPAGRVLVYDRTEWECFLDGVGRGEFDEAQ